MWLMEGRCNERYHILFFNFILSVALNGVIIEDIVPLQELMVIVFVILGLREMIALKVSVFILLFFIFNQLLSFPEFCPAAFDPIQLRHPLYANQRRQVRLETGHLGGYMYGQLIFSFGGESTLFNADAAAFTSQECQQNLQKMNSLSKVSCERETFDPITRTGSYLITLEDFPLKAHWNNVYQHNGNPPRDFFSCNVSKVDPFEAIGVYCTITDVNTEYIPGNVILQRELVCGCF